MATQPNPHPVQGFVESSGDSRLTYDEWWDLVESLFGSAREAYAEVGGSEAFMRAEHAAWNEDERR